MSRDKLKNMLNNIINDDKEAATADLHDILRDKMSTKYNEGAPKADTDTSGDGEND